tara:strand:- start:2418 stop:2693 length:276 start_codon:yes stop_codon:yes gene_type:complete
MDDQQKKIMELEQKFLLFEQKLLSGIDSIKDNQKEAVAAIVEIHDAIFDPDRGLFARVKEVETWKQTSSKLLWIITTSTVGLVLAQIFKVI